MTAKEAAILLDERRSQLAEAKANVALWRKQVRIAEELVAAAENEVAIAASRPKT